MCFWTRLFICAIKIEILFLNYSKLIDIIIISAMWFYVGNINFEAVFLYRIINKSDYVLSNHNHERFIMI